MRISGAFARHIALALLVLSAIYPVYFVVTTALRTNEEYVLNPLGFPTNPTFENFAALVAQAPVFNWLANSLMITATSVLINTTAGLLAAYALVFGRPKGSETVLRSSIAFMSMPVMVMLPALYPLMASLGLTNSPFSVILIFGGLMTPFATFVFANFLSDTPVEVYEAGRVDGARPFQILRFIVGPMARPAIGTVAVVTAVTVWNDLLLALIFLQDNTSRTLVSGLVQFDGPYVSNVPLIMAGACIVLGPLLVLFVLAQNYLVRGSIAGMGK